MGMYGRFPLPSDIPSSSTNKRRNGTEGSMLSEYCKQPVMAGFTLVLTVKKERL
jgi:hypothetical protein